MSYKPSGRLTGRTEAGPAASGSESFTYDPTYGFKTSETLGAHSYNGMMYDTEGNLLNFGVDSTPISGAFAHNYSVRGEMMSLPLASYNPNTGTQAFANGANVGSAKAPLGWAGTMSWDDRMGMSDSSNNNGTQPGDQGYSGSSSRVSVDADGRVIGNGNYAESDVYKAITDTVQAFITSNGTARSYDALNHVSTTVLGKTTTNKAGGSTSSSSAASYGWGVDEHPLLVGVAQSANVAGADAPPVPTVSSYDTLHWDGGQPLFETNSAGQVDEIFVGKSGAILPLDTTYRGLTWLDRKPDGTVGYCRNATGSCGQPLSYSPHLADFSTFSCSSAGASGVSMPSFTATTGVTSVGQGAVMTMPRTDGISDGVDVIQGVRDYDGSIGAWTTPDAYAGDIHDPSSQKSYMWNGNNPVSYSDPSGYMAMCWDCIGGGGDAGIEMRAEQICGARAYYAAGDWTAQLQLANLLGQQLTLLTVPLKFLFHPSRACVVHLGLGVAGAGQLQIGLHQSLLRLQIKIAQA